MSSKTGNLSATLKKGEGSSRPPRAARRRFNWPGFIFIVAILLLWELLADIGLVSPRLLPSPHAIIIATGELVGMGEFFPAFFYTLWSTLQGWFVGGVVGLILGALIGGSIWTWRFSMVSIDFLRAIPAVTLVPVSVLLLGFSLEMELMVTTYAALWPTLVNTVDGIRGTSDMHRETGKMLHLSVFRRSLSVSLPSAAGSIIVGLRLSLALSLMLAIVAEIVANPSGMGYSLEMARQALRPDRMFVYILAIGLTGVLLNGVFNFVTRLVFPGIVASLNEDGE
jgi:ABC-type nitrate/sulfonate/bicarbonate transport system permease component